MGADLYNERYFQKHPELVAYKAEMDDYIYGRNGKPNLQDRNEAERVAYSKLYDTLYGDPLYYFRENYGGEGLLSLMGLSWWRDVIPLQDIKPPEGLTEEEREAWWENNLDTMSAEACQQFIDLLQSRKAIVDAYPENEWEEGTSWRTGEPYRANVGQWYRERFDRLITFLQQGVADGGISASL